MERQIDIDKKVALEGHVDRYVLGWIWMDIQIDRYVAHAHRQIWIDRQK